MYKHGVVELVVFKVKGEFIEHKMDIINALTEDLQQMDGFVSRKIMTSKNDPLMIMDYITWESLEEAMRAVEAISALESNESFKRIIDQVIFMDHFSATEEEK